MKSELGNVILWCYSFMVLSMHRNEIKKMEPSRWLVLIIPNLNGV
jgi:hypothetical protein